MSTGIGSVPVHDAAPAGRHRSEKAVVLALSLAAMIVSMMLTLVVPILSLIQSSLHTTAANASWVTTATLLSAAVFTPLLGRFGDQHGKKPTLVGVLLVLIAGTVLAATTHSLLWLITGRVLQGAATAIFPLSLSILREEIRPQKLPAALATASGAFAFGSGIALVAPPVCSQPVPTPTIATCSGWPPGSPSSSSSPS
ncbi:MFS transporter [Streptomyces sp. DSM 40750]|uniref:MFS transporter n=1 Tax=Streptomyces sp. DSM 40750 TaxID=2801030 RepID=UPI0027D450EA|nr:MFS transporter [Streptomyces sp. DSM 40750]